MTSTTYWLSVAEFALLRRITPQAARKALRCVAKGRLWRGERLVVRTLHGRGGRSGLRYEVLLSSLPESYQRALIDASELTTLPELPAIRPVPASDQGKTIHARWLMIEEALDYPLHSAERKAELERAARKWGKSVRTLQRYIQQLEEAGGDLNALAHIRHYDRKSYDDMKPRIRRDNSRLRPMEQVNMDVKPLDCVLRRPDGSEVWPKMIGFMDTGTHRIFPWFVMLNKGEGVRQEHVTEAFLAMVSHPEWGFPQQLYRDNGTEFYHFDLIRSALEMVAEEGARTIINAKPYSGSSKPIESKFAMLDRQVFSQMAGYAGGNRMNKKTQTVGKPTAPYPGTFEEFCAEAMLRIQDFESWEIRSGPFKGKSPAQCYQDHCNDGWRPPRS